MDFSASWVSDGTVAQSGAASDLPYLPHDAEGQDLPG